ncbi:MAG: twin-arginine translocase subunit TatC [Lachnospiraceae bacterium]|nr:twin-arginine translocase subunit TatC [Lachnospiraceae bacterium]
MEDEKQMTVTGHLKELRNRTVICILVLVAVFMAALYFASDLVTILLSIGLKYNYTFVYISPQELLVEYFSVAICAALCITLPLILYQSYAFMSPGLKKNEQFFFKIAMICGTFCFVLGVVFAFKVMLPFMLYFLIHVSDGMDVTSTISVQNYLSFLLTVFICFGVIFELPVVSTLLTRMGLLKSSWMKKGRRVMIVVIFIVAAFITPPDVVSQIMVAIPIMGLYEISIMLSGFCEKFRKEEKKEETE